MNFMFNFILQAVAVHQIIFKDIRKWSDSKYDHSSPLLQKVKMKKSSIRKSNSTVYGKVSELFTSTSPLIEVKFSHYYYFLEINSKGYEGWSINF